MIKITDNKWRPFIELTLADAEPCTMYLDVTKRPIIIQTPTRTNISFDTVTYFVKESAKDIIAAVDKLIEAEQDKKAEEARQYMEATMTRVAETAKKVEK